MLDLDLFMEFNDPQRAVFRIYAFYTLFPWEINLHEKRF